MLRKMMRPSRVQTSRPGSQSLVFPAGGCAGCRPLHEVVNMRSPSRNDTISVWQPSHLHKQNIQNIFNNYIVNTNSCFFLFEKQGKNILPDETGLYL